jgi:hypothetical protein
MNETTLLDMARNGSAYGVWALVVVAIITLIKGWPALRKLSLEADGSLRKDLFARIHELEEQLAVERRDCAVKLEELRAEVVGLHRQMVTQQLISTGKFRDFPPATAESVKRRGEEDDPEGLR